MTPETIHTYAPYLFYTALLCVVVLSIACALWAGSDAKKRGKSSLLVFLLVLLVQFPMGIIAWLIFRPALAEGGNLGGSIASADPDAALKRRSNAGSI